MRLARLYRLVESLLFVKPKVAPAPAAPPERNYDYWYTRFFVELHEFTPNQRADMWCRFNIWRWPEELLAAKPACYDLVPGYIKYEWPIQRALAKAFEHTTPHKLYSRRWEREIPHMVHEHEAWYENAYGKK
jgi:hypothetical protein